MVEGGYSCRVSLLERTVHGAADKSGGCPSRVSLLERTVLGAASGRGVHPVCHKSAPVCGMLGSVPVPETLLREAASAGRNPRDLIGSLMHNAPRGDAGGFCVSARPHRPTAVGDVLTAHPESVGIDP